MQKKVISTDNPQSLPPLLYRGSVKNVRGQSDGDQVLFEYSDRYSVFDWGEMPDPLPQKGAALAVMADAIYRRLGEPWGAWTPVFAELAKSPRLKKLQTEGLAHHGISLVDSAGKQLAPGTCSSLWLVRACERHLPEFQNGTWDYAWYQSVEAQNIERPMLVPLEVVFRFGAPEGSSFFKRTNENYVHSLGLSKIPSPGEWFEKPIVEYFTKLEATDRFLTVEEAKHIAGLSEAEENSLRELSLLIACRIKDIFAELGLALWDGKFEFAFLPGRELCLVDAIGPDELRLTSKKGVHVSKEYLRQYYRDSAWYKAAEQAKKMARARGQEDWKEICISELNQAPESLPESVRDIVAGLYLAMANELTHTKVFPETKSLAALLEGLA